MFGFLEFFFSIKVIEENNRITVSHVPVESIENDIKKVYKTSRVSKYLFNSINKTSFEIESFFALELYFILTNMLAARRLGTNVKVLKEIQVKLKENTWLKNIDKDFPVLGDIFSITDRMNRLAFACGNYIKASTK